MGDEGLQMVHYQAFGKLRAMSASVKAAEGSVNVDHNVVVPIRTCRPIIVVQEGQVFQSEQFDRVAQIGVEQDLESRTDSAMFELICLMSTIERTSYGSLSKSSRGTPLVQDQLQVTNLKAWFEPFSKL